MDGEVNTAAVDLTQSEVGAARAETPAASETESSTGGTPVPLVADAERVPEITPAGELVLEGAESQAAAGAVNELQAVRAKLGDVRDRLSPLEVRAENIAEHQRLHADRIAAIEADLKAVKEQLGAAVRLGLVREEREHEIDERKERNGSRGRACLELLARQVEALGGDRTVNQVRSTLDGVAAGGE